MSFPLGYNFSIQKFFPKSSIHLDFREWLFVTVLLVTSPSRLKNQSKTCPPPSPIRRKMTRSWRGQRILLQINQFLSIAFPAASDAQGILSFSLTNDVGWFTVSSPCGSSYSVCIKQFLMISANQTTESPYYGEKVILFCSKSSHSSKASDMWPTFPSFSYC